MSDQPASRIIVDEDWKAQAQAEKEAAERLRAAAHSSEPAESAAEVKGTSGQSPDRAADATAERPQRAESQPKPQDADAKQAAADDPPLPPASLVLLIGTLATQAMTCLGMFPDPETNQMVVRLNQAKHAIDLLGVLEEKTAGNVTDEERHMLADSLYQLRMAYVAVKTKGGASGK